VLLCLCRQLNLCLCPTQPKMSSWPIYRSAYCRCGHRLVSEFFVPFPSATYIAFCRLYKLVSLWSITANCKTIEQLGSRCRIALLFGFDGFRDAEANRISGSAFLGIRQDGKPSNQTDHCTGTGTDLLYRFAISCSM